MSKDFSLSHLCPKASSSAGTPCRWGGRRAAATGSTDAPAEVGQALSSALSPGTCAGFWQGTKRRRGVPSLSFISLNLVVPKSRMRTPSLIRLRGRSGVGFLALWSVLEGPCSGELLRCCEFSSRHSTWDTVSWLYSRLGSYLGVVLCPPFLVQLPEVMSLHHSPVGGGK